MKKRTDAARRCIDICRELFAGMGSFRARPSGGQGIGGELVLGSGEDLRHLSIAITIRERITPQIAAGTFDRLLEEANRRDCLGVLYAPTISPRVAELAREAGVSYLDAAGNCRIIAPRFGLYIERSGREDPAVRRKQRAAHVFSTKSSRIIRTMLHEPSRRWQVGELARHSDVEVSLGLVAKVKEWLIREHYAAVVDRTLVLTRPTDLLDAWAARYRKPTHRHAFYLRGGTQAVEEHVAAWCRKRGIRHALFGLSAAWRLVPEVRYSVASLAIQTTHLDEDDCLAQLLQRECGATAVDTGANLVVLEPLDDSVFLHAEGSPVVSTSPLQTYLDLSQSQGRGPEAAQAVFDRFLREPFDAVQAARRT